MNEDMKSKNDQLHDLIIKLDHKVENELGSDSRSNGMSDVKEINDVMEEEEDSNSVTEMSQPKSKHSVEKLSDIQSEKVDEEEKSRKSSSHHKSS